MRLWTIHPCYLDAAGLVAAWREGLLAQKVLAGGTRGYTRHPQLERFKSSADPMRSIGKYLHELLAEAWARGYFFDSSKIADYDPDYARRIEVNEGQIRYELTLLEWKLERRASPAAPSLKAPPAALSPLPSPLDPSPPAPALSSPPGLQPGLQPRVNGAFLVRPGPIESWERPIEELLGRMDGV
jgi:hypothetical protein